MLVEARAEEVMEKQERSTKEESKVQFLLGPQAVLMRADRLTQRNIYIFLTTAKMDDTNTDDDSWHVREQ